MLYMRGKGHGRRGLIAAPDIPEKIANEVAAELPDLLGGHVDHRVP
jgi:hypothetical protein